MTEQPTAVWECSLQFCLFVPTGGRPSDETGRHVFQKRSPNRQSVRHPPTIDRQALQLSDSARSPSDDRSHFLVRSTALRCLALPGVTPAEAPDHLHARVSQESGMRPMHFETGRRCRISNPNRDGHGSQSTIPKPRRTRSKNGPVIFKLTPHTASYAIIAAGLHRRRTPRLRLATQCGTQGLSYSGAVNISLAKLCPLASLSYRRTFGHADWWRATRQ
ncbi:uncharacterized protein B0T23DRAFT_154993 [Neurospora hispaniola]|uniref:Uncharacterized protein n=1 Tax=Neurospora hispaniola TaxID=588809 RepID=A0AAJ0MS18_9PEZI|nr:hypothetical protein B0T23DRAFT_154993 [Neurospora hispaniola]